MLTYKEAYDKIIDAYFKDEINPMSANFCFCGTLAPDSSWIQKHLHKVNKHPYSYEEYRLMEVALLNNIKHDDQAILLFNGIIYVYDQLSSTYEDDLFKGMCAALDVLKDIHRQRGENVDDEVAFTKRQLVYSL
jgi:hypothetical protein